MKLSSIFLIQFFFAFVFSVCTKNREATMYIGSKGEKTYTGLMQGDLNKLIPKNIDLGSPIIASIAVFPDGNYVIGGILKSGEEKYNIIFMWVFNSDGKQYDGWPIDVSDMEDFDSTGFTFKLGNDNCDYTLHIAEKKRPKTIAIE